MTAPAWAGDAEALQLIFRWSVEYDLQETRSGRPTWATIANDRLPDVTEAANRRRLGKKREFEALEVDRVGLEPADRANYDIFGRLLRDEIAEYEFETYLTPITIVPAFTSNSPSCRRTCP